MLEDEIPSDSDGQPEVLVDSEDGRTVRLPFDLYNRMIPARWGDRRLVLIAPGRFAVTTPWIICLLALAAMGGGAVAYLISHLG